MAWYHLSQMRLLRFQKVRTGLLFVSSFEGRRFWSWRPALIKVKILSVSLVFLSVFSGENPGIYLHFKNHPIALNHPMRRDPRNPMRRVSLTNAQLDTLSHWYSPARKYVEIIRQDHPVRPHYGIALGFEFDADVDDFPYSPAHARLQFKDFTWGGVEFSPVDSCNFTGVTNDVSNDLTIFVDDYRNDTIFGRFSGLLLSAAGPMAQVDSGYFQVFLYRVE